MEKVVSAINDIVWNPALVGLLLVAGLYFSIRTRFVQVRRFGTMLRSLFSNRAGKEGGMSSFEAFCLALSGRVGTGNIVGVATAIAFGGPGAVFWMWVVAFLGASTAFVESTLSQLYKFRHGDGYRGGPFSLLDKGLGKRWLGAIFAVVTIIGCGLFLSTVQSNGASTAMQNGFPVPPLATGLTMALLLGLVIIGGARRIARVARVITPIMALGYLILALVVIIAHIQDIPAVFASIFKSAFGVGPLCSGIVGSAIAMGVKRGIFSNEAGQGTGAIVSAAADVPHPAQQGLAQAFSVYVDTLLVCTATALMILTSGTYNILDGEGGYLLLNAPELGNNYAGFTQNAVDTVFPGFGSQFISVAMVFFSFTTMLAYYFYSESSLIYLFLGKNPKWEKICVRVLQIAVLGAVIFGSVREADVVWMLGDIGVGLMAWGTVITILILGSQAIKSLKEFENLKP
ncbi:MAG: alanine:cation symporter family protein [Bacteroidales bacterium]|nr:alanine:cation symporter family protein [Bacteroidales bacterium]